MEGVADAAILMVKIFTKSLWNWFSSSWFFWNISITLSYDFDHHCIILLFSFVMQCHVFSSSTFLFFEIFFVIRLSYILIVFCIPFLFVHLSIFDLWIGIQLSETICCRNSRRRREGKDSERNPVSSGCWWWWYYG